MQLALIKQGVTSYGHIEAGIERAAREVPGLELRIFDLSKHYFSQAGELAARPHPQRMAAAAAPLLAELLADDTAQLLLLNGFVLERYRPGFFAALRQAGKRVSGWQIDDPYYFDMACEFAPQLDLVLSVDTSTVPLYASLGIKAVFLPLACDPALHHPYAELAPAYRSDVCFVGTPFAGSRRTQLIDALADCLPKYDTRIVGATDRDSWRQSLAHFARLERCIRDQRVGPRDAARLFSGARINLNLHKDSWGHAWDRNEGRIAARSPNERSFAIAGCGGFQLVDDARADLATQFEPGAELVTFSDAADLARKIAYYLDPAHEGERARIAQAGLERALAGHTYRHRLEAILRLL